MMSWLICLAAFPGLSQPSAPSVAAPVQVLTNAAQLRALPLDHAELQLPVRLRATVTGITAVPVVFLQDETGGTFIVLPRGSAPGITPGDVIEVSGVTHPGWYMSGIRSTRLHVVDRAELPPPTPVDFDDLLSCRWHYQRVEIGGIVRSVKAAPARNGFLFTVALGPRKLEVRVAPNVAGFAPPVDARVRLTGLAAGYINHNRQLIAPHLFVSQIEDIRVENPPPSNPFDAPLRSFGELLNFNPEGISGHRVRVRGVVTHQQPGQAVFLRDAGRGLLVRTAQSKAVQPGDIVEVVGFPVMDRFSALLEDAEFRVMGRDAAPEPLRVTIQEVLEPPSTSDANLITLEAQLIETIETPTESILVLRADNTMFRARMPRTAFSVRNGSNVRVTGICRVQESTVPDTGFRANPGEIELLLRSPEDIVVQATPSWWTARRLAVLTTALLGLALAALVWISMLRRRVTEQAGIIRDKVQREAALEERHRMAREMHDTLAQSFSGLGFQLDALDARLPSEAAAARTQLETARQIVRHGQEDFRRTLRNLRAQELERGGLAEALPEVARHITADTGIELRCDIDPLRRGLPEAVESNLLRIGQECLTNAVRHAHPKRIDLALKDESGGLQLRIADDGLGFDPQQLKETNGHFGWRGIRERAEQIRARVDIDSQPGRGTVVTFTVLI